MRKIMRMVLVLTIMNLLLVSSFSTAQSAFLYSVRAQKTPSGQTLTDYSDAKSVIVSNMHTKEIYLKNSESNLYIAFRVAKNSSFLGLALLFDVDHDQVYTDDVKILFSNQTTIDGYYYLNSALSLQAQSYFTGSVNNISYVDGKTYDFYQFTIPFNPGSSPTTDMYISDPSDYMLGFDFVEIMNNSLISWTRGDLGTAKTIQALPNDASSFYTMILAGPGKFAVPDFNPVTASSSTVAPSTQQTTASSSGTYNNAATSSTMAAGTPGFEFVFLFTSFVFIVGGKKIRDRRLNK